MVIIFQRKNLNDALLNRHKLLIVKFDENENTVRKKVEKHHTNPTNNNHKSFNFIKSRRDLKKHKFFGEILEEFVVNKEME